VICKLNINTTIPIQRGGKDDPVLYAQLVVSNVMQINFIVSHGRMLLNFLEEIFSLASLSLFLHPSRLRAIVIEYEIIGVEVETLLHFSLRWKSLFTKILISLLNGTFCRSRMVLSEDISGSRRETLNLRSYHEKLVNFQVVSPRHLRTEIKTGDECQIRIRA
jgi:hypothetical protein